MGPEPFAGLGGGVSSGVAAMVVLVDVGGGVQKLGKGSERM